MLFFSTNIILRVISPWLFFQEVGSKLVPILVSDGLCRLYQLSREVMLNHLRDTSYITANMLTAARTCFLSNDDRFTVLSTDTDYIAKIK